MAALRKRRVLSARKKPDGTYVLILECMHLKNVTVYREGSAGLCVVCPPLQRKKGGK